MEHLVLIIFLAFFFTRLLVEGVLEVLNARHVLAHRQEAPAAVAEAFSAESRSRAVDYTLARTRLNHVGAAAGAFLALFYLFSGMQPWLNGLAMRIVGAIGGPAANLRTLSAGVLLICFFALLNAILSLPLELYEAFRLEARFGFNQTTARTFWLDRLKGLLLGGALGVPFLYALLAFIFYAGSWWWLYAACFVIAWQLLLHWLYPLLIAPLFNKFTPLEEGELQERLEKLSRQCNFAVRGIFVMDGSKRSAHSNAYFTGVGRARRIVLFDTLIRQMSGPELAAVLAHEIGHYRKKHILKMLLFSSAATLAGFYILHLLLYWPPLYAAFGLGAPSVPLGLLLFGLLSGPLLFWAHPLINWLSRKYEYEADTYAAAQTGAAPLETALVKLSEKNLSALFPHPLYSAYNYSHPALAERIGALKSSVQNAKCKTQNGEA